VTHDLLDRDPTVNSGPQEIVDVAQKSRQDNRRVEILDYSRIIDLRHWDPSQKSRERQGGVYVKDRVMLLIPEDANGGDAWEPKVCLPLSFAIQGHRMSLARVATSRRDTSLNDAGHGTWHGARVVRSQIRLARFAAGRTNHRHCGNVRSYSEPSNPCTIRDAFQNRSANGLHAVSRRSALRELRTSEISA